jgi:cytochrome c biogenesis protein CcmG, thiol:disulfide interchange protein DsbE
MKTSRLHLVAMIFAVVLICIGAASLVGGLLLTYNTPGLSLLGLAPPTPTIDLSAALPALPGAPRVGNPAPDFALKTFDQQTVRLSQFRGKPVIVNFWATWCGPCSAEMPNIEKVYQEHQDRDVTVLAVNQGETADEVRGYADLYHLHFTLLLDGNMEVGHLYRVQALPTTFFIDRSGIIHEIHIGGPMSPQFIEGRIQSLLR